MAIHAIAVYETFDINNGANEYFVAPITTFILPTLQGAQEAGPQHMHSLLAALSGKVPGFESRDEANAHAHCLSTEFNSNCPIIHCTLQTSFFLVAAVTGSTQAD